MSRRIRAGMILTLMILTIGCCGFAESGTIPSIRETIQAEPDPKAFSFRNGISWNMDNQQVRTLENVAMNERASDDWSVMVTNEPVPVSRFSADLVFMFYQNRLKMITYEFRSDGSTLNYQYLLGALCSVYGESRNAEPAVIRSMMDRIYPGRYREDWIRESFMWTTPDGTHIFLYYFSADAYAILYTSPELTFQGSGGYETNGL